ncbi:MAG: hypothetical protein Kow0025_11560 [Thermodesulfovibrionales bacterium]
MLSRVMDAEGEISRRLQEERERIRKWLDEVRTETEEYVERESRRLRAELEASVMEALDAAREAAARKKAEAAARAEGLRRLDDGKLREIAARRVAGLLPG